MRTLLFALLFGLILPPYATGTTGSVLGVDRAYMDLSLSPCEDFYGYACGAFAKVPIPGDQASWGVNQELDERNFAILRDILEGCARTSAAKGSPARRLGDFYASGMDESEIEMAGLEPLKAWLDGIDALKTPVDVVSMIGRFHAAGLGAGFEFGVQADDKNSSAMIAAFRQGGLGLPERDYYLDSDKVAKDIRRAYIEHMEKILVHGGDKPAGARRSARAVFKLETRLAKASRDMVALRDPDKNYHKIWRTELPTLAPSLAWEVFFSEVAFPGTEQFVLVGQPEFFAAFAGLLHSEKIATWQAYLRWQLLSAAAPHLTQAFVAENFAFYGRKLSGATELKPRWKRILAATDGALGEDLGQLYVQRAFSPAAKAKVATMVNLHLDAMAARINKSEWMTAPSKTAAIKKISTLRTKIGYPETWRDYSSLEISRRPHVLNVLAASLFETRRRMAKLGRPVDRNDWEMTPQTNNAYYDGTHNEMVFPAGILQPPFFDERADDAVNYGAIGATIGHELTHAFDDEGRQYDWEGNLKPWWSDEDVKRFQERAELVAKQYFAYEALPGLHLDGHQTLGENIADVGGLRVAYEAFKLATKDAKPELLDGFTPEQRFFIAYAQSWRTNERPERIRLSVTSDVHSPSRFRVIGPVKNFPEFYAAFGCPPPPAKLPEIW
jgi:predicted metalloendopeptidase